MLHKTKGIVLKVTDYDESSVIVKIYTQKFGLQSYLINGVKKPKAKIRMNMLQPLHLLDMVVYQKPNRGVQRISDARNNPVFKTIPYEIAKSSLAIFINEVLYKCFKQQTDEPVLFDFIYNNIIFLDTKAEGIANFHLIFLIKLTRFLGFYPDMSMADTSKAFDLINGVFLNNHPPHAYFVNEDNLQNWLKIIRSTLSDLDDLKINAKTRKYLLEKILDYYYLHIDGFGKLKSVQILEEVLN